MKQIGQSIKKLSIFQNDHDNDNDDNDDDTHPPRITVRVGMIFRRGQKIFFWILQLLGVAPPQSHISAQGWKLKNPSDGPKSIPPVTLHTKFQVSTIIGLACRVGWVRKWHITSLIPSEPVFLSLYFCLSVCLSLSLYLSLSLSSGMLMSTQGLALIS